MAKRGASGLSFVLAVDKPKGMSSHDVVNICRSAYGERRVGHAGTLDPLASGVMIVCVGPATRLDAFLVGHGKAYEAKVRFGASTETDDAEGDIVDSCVPQDELRDGAFAQRILTGFLGDQMQIPPAYSAIKVAGKRSYAQARKGLAVELEARPVRIEAISLLSIAQSDRFIDWDVSCAVSSGTYIRALARDLGRAAGCPAHLAELRRTAIGRVGVEASASIEAVQDGAAKPLDPVALLAYPVLSDEEALQCALNGKPVRRSLAVDDGQRLSLASEATLKAVYVYDAAAQTARPACVFQTGVSRG